jgi:hypothetical protein
MMTGTPNVAFLVNLFQPVSRRFSALRERRLGGSWYEDGVRLSRIADLRLVERAGSLPPPTDDWLIHGDRREACRTADVKRFPEPPMTIGKASDWIGQLIETFEWVLFPWAGTHTSQLVGFASSNRSLVSDWVHDAAEEVEVPGYGKRRTFVSAYGITIGNVIRFRSVLASERERGTLLELASRGAGQGSIVVTLGRDGLKFLATAPAPQSILRAGLELLEPLGVGGDCIYRANTAEAVKVLGRTTGFTAFPADTPTTTVRRAMRTIGEQRGFPLAAIPECLGFVDRLYTVPTGHTDDGYSLLATDHDAAMLVDRDADGVGVTPVSYF